MKSFSELPDWTELRKLWKQEPLDPPKPESELELTPDSWVERGAEVIGWSLARLEYWLSESGWLRAWLRFNLWLAIVLIIAGVLLIPAVSKVLKEFAESTHWAAAIVDTVISTLAALPPVVISFGFLYLVYLLVRRFRLRRRSRLYGQQEDGYFQ